MKTVETVIIDFLNWINEPLGMFLIAILVICSVWFTIITRGVQFRLLPEMFKVLFRGDITGPGKQISPFQAFTVSIASRVGTGNIAGVATAIALGGPGAIFWMWVMALFGAASAFMECTLAQLFKIRGKDSFIGGPA